eukprot:9371998-Pyramimonas_sp.AAC.1
MHKTNPSTHRNRRRMGFANQVVGDWGRCLREHEIGQLVCGKKRLHHKDCTANIAPQRFQNIDCTAYLHTSGRTALVAPRGAQSVDCNT